MNENKLKEYIAHTCDCNYCRKIGIDVKNCDGDCVENILNFLTKNG